MQRRIAIVVAAVDIHTALQQEPQAPRTPRRSRRHQRSVSLQGRGNKPTRRW